MYVGSYKHQSVPCENVGPISYRYTCFHNRLTQLIHPLCGQNPVDIPFKRVSKSVPSRAHWCGFHFCVYCGNSCSVVVCGRFWFEQKPDHRQSCPSLSCFSVYPLSQWIILGPVLAGFAPFFHFILVEGAEHSATLSSSYKLRDILHFACSIFQITFQLLHHTNRALRSRVLLV